MKQAYKSPRVNVYKIQYETPLLVGSMAYAAKEGYACPYRLTLYCRLYSEHMRAFKSALERAAKNKENLTLHTTSGCPYKETCELYKQSFNEKTR